MHCKSLPTLGTRACTVALRAAIAAKIVPCTIITAQLLHFRLAQFGKDVHAATDMMKPLLHAVLYHMFILLYHMFVLLYHMFVLLYHMLVLIYSRPNIILDTPRDQISITTSLFMELPTAKKIGLAIVDAASHELDVIRTSVLPGVLSMPRNHVFGDADIKLVSGRPTSETVVVLFRSFKVMHRFFVKAWEASK